MFLSSLMAELELEVWDRLSAVTDPELDEPITDMNFVEAVTVAADQGVTVQFRLPTYWCSPNFAFLMAIGIRREVMALRWVRGVTVRLMDHCFGDEVNAGVNSGRGYAEIFARHCNGAKLDEVVETFLAKAFDRRQESLLVELRRMGRSPGAITGMRVAELRRIALADAEALRQRPRYLELLFARGLARDEADPAFPRWTGEALAPEELTAHLGRLRATRINMEFNGALCRGLSSSRYREVEIGPEGPTLTDFIAGRVPPREDARP